MDQPDLSAMDHSAKDDLIRFLLAENAELKSRITALEVRLAEPKTAIIPASRLPQMACLTRS
jgi:hypothetical protein